jgi:hypothetical protein
MLTTALAYMASGRSVLPIAPGEKRPSIINTHGEIVGITWDAYQTTPADEATIRDWFPPDQLMGIGIACGPVSGRQQDGVTHALEVLDLDDEQTLDTFIEAANFQGHSDLLARLVHQRTPGGAGHFAYVCAQWSGNTKLAQRQEGVDKRGKPQVVTLIETRGAGGQAVVAPTPPRIHPEHPERGYELVRGSWEDLPIITPEARQALWDLARSFNEYVEPAQVHTTRTAGRSSANGNRPGDWLNRTVDRDWWRALLERHEWTLVQERRGIQYWCRPGKDAANAWSATLGACGPYFYVFSSNASPFQPEQAYLPFAAYALLQHNGDFQAAARALMPQRFAAEWPGEAVALALLERLLVTPEARLVSEALPELGTLSREAWQATKYAIKGLLGSAVNLTDVDADWKKATRTTRPGAETLDETAGEDGRPVIHITPAIPTVVDAAQSAILALPNGPQVFQRARKVCFIARGVSSPKWLIRPPDLPVIMPTTAARLTELAATAAAWVKFDKRSHSWEPALPPAWVADTLASRGEWTFPVLEGIVHAPTLRPDGSILDTPGYDPDTGLLLDLHGPRYPAIPARPTLDNARTAIGILQEPLLDFPFAEPHDLSATLAYILTPVARPAIQGPVPLGGISANTPGTGKGLLADLISLIGTGRHATKWPQVSEEEEERKRLLSIGLAGYPLVCIDNVTRPMGSPALDMALTSLVYSDRALGVNQAQEVPMTCVFLATGNNLSYKADLLRRVVPITLFSTEENPEARTTFRHPRLLLWVAEHRPSLVVAALTILRGFFVAGCPAQHLSPIGSYEAWSDLVRQTLVWAGEADPAAGRAELAQEQGDPEVALFRVLLECWHTCYQATLDTPRTLKNVLADIQDKAREGQADTQGNPLPITQWDELRDALGAFDARYDGKTLHIATAAGYALKRYKGRIVAGKRFVSVDPPLHGATRWLLQLTG